MAVESMEKIVALAKNRGFVYPGSEIYGGLANTWDYGPLGVELKNNMKKAWWKKFIQENPKNVGVDCAILMNPQTWVASGHVGGFSDPLMDCKECKERFRADKLIEDHMASHDMPEVVVDGWTNEEMKKFVDDNQVVCPSCGAHNFTDVQDLPGRNRGCEKRGLSASRNCTGYLRKLQKRAENHKKKTALWYRSDW